MNDSPHARLLRRLQEWQFWPCAAVFYLDLHDFRNLNRLASPAVADAVIASVGAVLHEWAGRGGVAGRLWSNEFAAAKAMDHPQSAIDEARELRELLMQRHFSDLPAGWNLSFSIGVICAKPGADWALLLRQAGSACEESKRRGTNQISMHLSSSDTRGRRINIDNVNDFRQLMSHGALTLQPQPIMEIYAPQPRLAKAEFLMRMEKSGVFMPLPSGMIESLERFGMATELDRFSCNFILSWLQENRDHRLLPSVSINLSGRSIADGAFMYRVFNDVRGADLPRGKLTFEITETTAVEHLDVASEVIAEFRSIGVGFSLDDFGSGLCSFGYLQSLQVEEVKIDGRFVRGVAEDNASEQIIRAINQVAHATGKRTVAEFVDERAKLEVLRRIGVDYAQGQLFYPTVTPEKLLELLESDDLGEAAAAAQGMAAVRKA
jgi:EAL domain-containing protein (putative c-di-GMP-specific phosphodiesterase class I)/GGDEF domain-containing protein